jgi:serine-type D-Ala-D-Ala carboxypeptidase/endopeptidase (penicillin-binding protein 4)
MFRAVFLAYLLSVSCLSDAGAQTPLPEKVVAMLRAANIGEEHLGIHAIRLSDGLTVLSHRPNQSMQPASSLKVLTAIAGLEQLGPTYRARTELRAAGNVINGVLEGDLVLRGMGDLDLDWESFRKMLQNLRYKGIQRIRGDLIIDRNWYRPARPDLGEPPFDETPEFRYNVIPDALMLNSNLVQLDMDSDASGVSVRMIPALHGVEVVTQMTMIDRVCRDWEDGWQLPAVEKAADGNIRIILKGNYPRNCSASTSINVLDRTDLAARMFRSLWTSLGGIFEGTTREGTMPAETKVLADHRSRTLAEFVRDINKRSDNPITRMLYLALAESAPGYRESADLTANRSEQVVREWMKQNRIDDRGLVLENGSGLSRSERVTPAQLAAILRVASQSRWAPEFMASLPIIGIDGAMRLRLHQTPAAQRGRFKTGSLRNALSVAGFVPDANNEMCIVVAILNHENMTGGVGRPILDAVIDAVAKGKSGVAPESSDPLKQYSGG